MLSLLSTVLIREALILGYHFEETCWPYSITSSSLHRLAVVDNTSRLSGWLCDLCCLLFLPTSACEILDRGLLSKQSISLFGSFATWMLTLQCVRMDCRSWRGFWATWMVFTMEMEKSSHLPFQTLTSHHPATNRSWSLPSYRRLGHSVMEKASVMRWNFSGPLSLIMSTARSIYKLVLIHLQGPLNSVKNLPQLPLCSVLVSKELCCDRCKR
jgi:hypothetical protein